MVRSTTPAVLCVGVQGVRPSALLSLALAMVLAVAGFGVMPGGVDARASGPDLETWDTTALTDDRRLSRVLGGAVLSRGGDRVGTVHDITIGAAGRLETVVVRVPVPGEDPRFFEVAWGTAEVDPARGAVVLGLDGDTLAARTKLETDVIAETADWNAKDLLALHVRLAGADVSGQVDDLLFDPAGRLSAYVVDLEGTPDLYALPWAAGALERGDRVVTFPFARGAVVAIVPWGAADGR
ncbi:PRC-barrel domain-containing protein [Roseospira goensis]|uniref:PRC-barrel domain-containing protein n=1 Tax=Roseospira goensis TaxID=391922 RepID=A0A7W6RYL1_9PROT|nr:PRC-barrel domain-containing protein [Roseospira goensis]MBB4285636.1 hypothetical protein [Roseospira goensis]